jgi:hypothetical protein
MNCDTNKLRGIMEDEPLAVLEEIRGVCLVKIVPTVS